MYNQEPAFPMIATEGFAPQGGMTLRDYFAAKAMAAILIDTTIAKSSEKIAEWSYNIADAMMEARNG